MRIRVGNGGALDRRGAEGRVIFQYKWFEVLIEDINES